MQKFSYHTHTNFSDGSNSLDEMLEQAVKLGWEEIGISNHFQAHKNIDKYIQHHIYQNYQKTSFKEKRWPLLRHIEEIRKAAKKHPIKILAGLEVDYFSYDGWEDEFREFIKEIDVDYLILGSHFCFGENDLLIDFSEASKPEHISSHFKNMQKGIESGLFDFVAHIDYVEKFTGFSTEDFQPEVLGVLDALVKTGTKTELNSKGFTTRNHKPNPSGWILQELKSRKVPIVVSCDAHNVDMLGIAYDQAEDLLSELDYTYRWRF
jgi:histidinol-phosphatase (PHP family)